MRIVFALLFGSLFATTLVAQWSMPNAGSTASLRGLSVVDENIVWASGSGGEVLRTIDEGKTWKHIGPKGAEKLDFRDIEAFDANTAYILSIGNGSSSTIYKTVDGGKTWKLQFQNHESKAFYDAIACWDAKHCVAMSDPVNGKFLMISTNDGENWSPLDAAGLPLAKEGEAAFAASGTCLVAAPGNMLYLITGGNDARVFRSYDRGRKWSVANTPMVKGTAGSGIFSIAMLNGKRGIIVGGNYEKPTLSDNNAFITSDGARTWKPVTGITGYRSGVAYLNKDVLMAVGSSGVSLSSDSGVTWKTISPRSLNSVAAGKRSFWAVGDKGEIVRYIAELK